jgi:hypothetical protein
MAELLPLFCETDEFKRWLVQQQEDERRELLLLATLGRWWWQRQKAPRTPAEELFAGPTELTRTAEAETPGNTR